MAAKKKTAKKKTTRKKKTIAVKKTAKKKSAVSKKASSKKKIVTKKKTSASRKIQKKKVVVKKAKKKVAGKKLTSKKKTVTKKTKVSKKVAKKVSPVKKKVAVKKKAASKSGEKTTRMPKKTVDSKIKLLRKADVTPIKPYKAKRNEEYMNTPQSAHFRTLLLDWKRNLMEEVDRTMSHMQDEAANFPDPNDRATQEEEFALELRTRDRERKLIKKIDEAVLMLEMGDYGYCELCGVEIGVGRLEARPTASLCIDCKTLDEIKERQLG